LFEIQRAKILGASLVNSSVQAPLREKWRSEYLD
jgi:hypothetical protein